VAAVPGTYGTLEHPAVPEGFHMYAADFGTPVQVLADALLVVFDQTLVHIQPKADSKIHPVAPPHTFFPKHQPIHPLYPKAALPDQ